ncbi:MAG: FMN-binding protein [Micrococcales bacterium]|uniref:FMN-binding protein n=1 Tax=Cellulomonas sp. P4 TaxID=3142533 RepID=UPI0019C2AEEF|nr:FMN-binding protein [Micrococcales bacterium]
MAPSVRRRTLGLLSGLSVVVALAACGDADAATEDDAPAADASAGTGAGGSSTASGDLADGTYDAEGSYSTPGGQESIQVELTVADGVVTDVTVTPEATGGNAARFQEEFASGIADVVVGQELAGLSVDKVSGSSLTGDGFNAALDEIRADAAA